MSDPTHLFDQLPIRVVFAPYDHDDVQSMLRQVVSEFGRPGDRWRYRVPHLGQAEQNAWVLDFHFADPYDATIFGLKYQR